MKEEEWNYLIKTQKDMEGVVASILMERGYKAKPRPYGFKGIVLACAEERDLRDIPEIEKAIKIDFLVRSELEEILSLGYEISKRIKDGETFAVRTKRRGKHDFTSIELNTRLGSLIREISGAEVNLENPDKTVLVEIIGETSVISIQEGHIGYKKNKGKMVRDLLSRTTVIQVPYLGPLDASKTMGVRIGRSAQAFEIKNLIISPWREVRAEELCTFIEGLLEGIRSRYEIQKRTYGREPHRVSVTLRDLYQLIREIWSMNKEKRLLIATDPRGEPIQKVKDEILREIKGKKSLFILIGSREGIPPGIFRFCDFTIDLCPGITFATEHGIPSSLIALTTLLEEC